MGDDRQPETGAPPKLTLSQRLLTSLPRLGSNAPKRSAEPAAEPTGPATRRRTAAPAARPDEDADAEAEAGAEVGHTIDADVADETPDQLIHDLPRQPRISNTLQPYCTLAYRMTRQPNRRMDALAKMSHVAISLRHDDSCDRVPNE